MNRTSNAGGEQRKPLLKRLEFRGIRRLSPHHYRRHVRNLYDGPAGAVLALSSFVSLHEPLVGHLLRTKRFDVSRFGNILDVGSGAGQILGHLLKEVAPHAQLTGFDLSLRMLCRARSGLRSSRPKLVAGDLTRLPFASQSFDCITCGYVLEHLADPLPGLEELGRVLKPGGSVLVLTTEDTVSGTMTSHAWKCRTYNRQELEQACRLAGLPWKEQLWFTAAHRFFKLGGILVEARKPDGHRSSQADWTAAAAIDAQGA